MMTCSDTLKQHIINAENLHMCELYEFTLTNGIILRYTSNNANVEVDGKTFLCHGPIINRSRLQLKLGATVDNMTVTIYTDGNDEVATSTFMQAARLGALDDGTLSFYQCYFNDDGEIVGALLIFKGEIEIKSGGGLKIELDCKSSLQRLDVEWPLRKYYVECPFSVYDSCCGVDIESFKVSGSVVNGSTSTVILTNNTMTANFYDNGGITFTSGVLNGVTMPIRTNTANIIYLMTELVATPAPGDTYKIYPGCNKTPAMCESRFHNGGRNRSTPYVPLPDTIA